MRFKDAFEILRPINDIMGTLTVIIGLLNTRINVTSNILIINIILGALTYFFIAGSGMVINDIYDYNSGIDIINRPERPLPSERITVRQAIIIWLSTLLIGIGISIINSLLIGLLYFNIIIAAIFGFMGWLYAKWGKKSGFYGNIIVSLSFSIGLIYGAVLNVSVVPIYIYFFFLTSFFLLLSREIVKGCEDIEGDKKEGVRTLAIRIGIRNSTYIAIISATLAIIFFILPIFTSIINPILFLISMIFGLADVLYAVILMLKKKLERKDFKRISLTLKIGAFLGLIAFVFASI